MHIKKYNFIIIMVSVVLGMLVSLQVRAIVEQSGREISAEDRYKQLRALYQTEVQNVLNYQKMIEEKEKIIKGYEKSAGKKDSQTEQMRLDAERYKVLAGLTDVIGEGVIITINDAEVRRDEFISESETIIHDSDIIELLNELRIAGVEAISVNDERIIATSEQICAGPTIKINDTKYATPFVIKAVGDREKIKAQLESPRCIINIFILRGIRTDIKYVNEVKVNKFKGSIYPLIGKKGN